MSSSKRTARLLRRLGQLGLLVLAAGGDAGKRGPDLALFEYAESPEQAWDILVKGGVLTRWLQEQHTT